ncbi:hypothetical protein ILUMI_00720 [Ignelater luminosus]|uniref:glutamine synthetase n=1 Tax=Ignelater luminosus TaxID=2038154 RepID=A0A8K0DJV5_IGNLU|nr:hypothetical protein ILUMI_00720 [Ignelater luminosus]
MLIQLVFKSGKNLSRFGKNLKLGINNFHTTGAYNSYHLEYSPNASLDKSMLDRYLCLPIPECKCQAKYVWIDGTGENVRSKTRTLDYVPQTYKDCPNWTYDGSSTLQATGVDSDLYLCPCALYNDPIRRGNNKLVLCEVYNTDHSPSKTNHRAACVEALNKICDKEPMFGFEQEYNLMDVDNRPYGWPAMLGQPAPAGPYYCGVGAAKAYGRVIVESHYRACLYAGISIYGTNAEVIPAQWEFQIGTVMGIKAADDLWMGRFLLCRIAEDFGIEISFDPKLFPNWNGAGCHANISTKGMRAEGGIKEIEKALCLLEKRHKEHIKVYDPKGGKDNRRRLTGKHETSSVDKFTSAVASRGTSVRINRLVAEAKRGYLEDRRPAANCDPYAVMNALVRTILLGEK